MPNPDAITIAETAKQITPDDATKLHQFAADQGVDPKSLVGNVFNSGYKDFVEQQVSRQKERQYGTLLQSEARAFSDWAQAGVNASRVQARLDDMIKLRYYVDAINMPETAGSWDIAAQGLATFGKQTVLGAKAVVAIGPSLVNEAILRPLGVTEGAAAFDFDTVLDMSDANQAEGAQAQGELAYRNAVHGGNGIQRLVGNVAGGLPESLAVGFGAGVLSKAILQRTLMSSGLPGVMAAASASPKQLASAFKTTIHVGSAYETGKVVTERMSGNVEEGKSLITPSDVAYAASVYALIYFTELAGGMTGENRMFGGRTKPSATREFTTQLAQEPVQELGQVFLDDITSGKWSGWDKYGYAGLGGLLGGFAFGLPGAIASWVSKQPLNVQRQAKALGVVSQAKNALETANATLNASTKLGELATSGTILEADLRAVAATNKGELFISSESFSKLAQSAGVTEASLLLEIGGKQEAGLIKAPTANVVAHMATKDEAYRQAMAESIQSSPTASSVEQFREAITMHDSLRQAAADTLDDGTKDDSAEIAAFMIAEVETAQTVAGSARKSRMAVVESELTAYAWRAAAEQWNAWYKGNGKTDRVTPKQLWTKYRPAITGEPGVGGLEQAEAPMADMIDVDGEARHTLNSQGKRIAQTDEAVRNFWKWFGDSKVVDEQGRPLVVYHGTQASFDVFMPSEAKHGAHTGAGHYFTSRRERAQGYGAVVMSVYLRSNKPFGQGKLAASDVSDITAASLKASGEADIHRPQMEREFSKPDQIEARRFYNEKRAQWEKAKGLQSHKPQVVFPGEGREGYLVRWRDYDTTAISSDAKTALADLLSQHGPSASAIIDAAGFDSVFGGSFRDGADIVVFSPTQIKSATGNVGAFDATDPSVLQQPSRGTYDWNKSLIRINKAADASTVHHEMMHHFLETMRRWAADPEAPDFYREQVADMATWASKDAAKIAKHYNKVTEGAAVTKEQVEAAAADMVNLDLNTPAGRAIHEGIAYGYEQYLSEGKAPTKELRRLFTSISNFFRGLMRKLVGSEFIDDRVRRVFNKMLTSSDMVLTNHISQEYMDTSGMSPEVAALLSKMYGEQLAAAEARGYSELKKRAMAQDEADLQQMIDAAKARLLTQPVYKAQVALAENKLDADAVRNLLAGTEHADLDLAAWTQKDGKNPIDLAEYVGAEDVQTLLRDLATADPVDIAARKVAIAEREASDAPTVEEQVDALANSQDGEVVIRLAEARVLADAAKLAGAVSAEVQASGKEKLKAVKEKAAETVAAEKAKSAETKAAAKARIVEETAKLRARVADVAFRIKAHKTGWDADAQKMLSEMRQNNEALIASGAEYRMETEPKTVDQLSSMVDAASRKMAKRAASGDFAAAARQYLEIQTLTEMQRIAASSAVTSVKAAAKANKTSTLEALKAQAVLDAQVLNAWAAQQVERIALMDLRPSRWASRKASAARRRELAAARHDPAAVIRATQDMAVAAAMEAACIRSAGLRAGMVKALNKLLADQTTLRSGGSPATIHSDTGEVTIYATSADAEAARMANASKLRVTLASDMLEVGLVITGLLQEKTKAGAMRDLSSLRGSKYLTPGVIRMIEDYDKRGESSLLNPQNWRMTELLSMVQQMEHLHTVAKQRDATDARLSSLITEGVAAIKPTSSTPPPQGHSWYSNPLFAGMLNSRTMWNPLGEWGRKRQEEATDAEISQLMFEKQVATILAPANKMMQKESFTELERPINSYGVETSRMQNLARLLLLGTYTGAQRVHTDLTARKCENIPEFLAGIKKGITKAEAMWLNSMWKANEQIWLWDVAAATSAGVALPKTLEATPFQVEVDGQVVELTGGYAVIAYEQGAETNTLEKNVTGLAVGTGIFNDREQVIEGKTLKLDVDGQHWSMRSHIRTAAFLKYQKDMSALLFDDSSLLKAHLQKTFGKDYVTLLQNHIRVTVLGNPEHTPAEKGISWLNRIMTFAVFGFNLKTAVSQAAGFSISAAHPDVGPAALTNAVLRAGVSLSDMSRFAARSDPYMALRREGTDVDTAAPSDLFGQARILRKWERTATMPMRVSQSIVDVITWSAAFERALADQVGSTDTPDVKKANAIVKARRAVIETQGSALRSEAAALNHTALGRAITFGGKFMMGNANWMMRAYQDMRGQGIDMSRGQFAKIVLASTVVSATLFTAIGAALQPEEEGKDHEWQDYAAKIGLDSFTQAHFAGRFLSSAISMIIFEGSMTSGKILDPLNTAYRGMNQVVSQIRDDNNEDDWAKSISGAIAAGSLVPYVPATQAKRFWDAVAVNDHATVWEGFLDACFGTNRAPRLRD